MTLEMVELVFQCPCNLLAGHCTLNQKNLPFVIFQGGVLNFCNISRGSIFHIKFIIISVSQAKIDLTVYSLRTEVIL